VRFAPAVPIAAALEVAARVIGLARHNGDHPALVFWFPARGIGARDGRQGSCTPAKPADGNDAPMTTISKDAKLVTLINVFTVEPANQRRLVELLARATDTSVRHAPGFVSASLHRSLDGTRVTMYAQWRTIEDYEAMRRNAAPAPFLQQALALATFEPGMYEVVESYSPEK